MKTTLTDVDSEGGSRFEQYIDVRSQSHAWQLNKLKKCVRQASRTKKRKARFYATKTLIPPQSVLNRAAFLSKDKNTRSVKRTI